MKVVTYSQKGDSKQEIQREASNMDFFCVLVCKDARKDTFHIQLKSILQPLTSQMSLPKLNPFLNRQREQLCTTLTSLLAPAALGGTPELSPRLPVPQQPQPAPSSQHMGLAWMPSWGGGSSQAVP